MGRGRVAATFACGRKTACAKRPPSLFCSPADRKGQPVIVSLKCARLRRASAALGLAVLGLGVCIGAAQAQDQDLSFLGRYTLEPDCTGQGVTLSENRLVVADLVCEVADIDIDTDKNGTFEMSLSECLQDGSPTPGNAVFGYQRDGDAVALSFWGPIIPIHRCKR